MAKVEQAIPSSQASVESHKDGHGRENQEASDRESRHKRESERLVRDRKDRKKREQRLRETASKHKRDKIKLDFKEAKKLAVYANTIRDERKLVLTEKQLAQLVKDLKEAGYQTYEHRAVKLDLKGDKQSFSEAERVEVLLATQDIVLNAEVRYPDTEGLDAREKLEIEEGILEIKKAQDPTEEKLTEVKIRENFSVTKSGDGDKSRSEETAKNSEAEAIREYAKPFKIVTSSKPLAQTTTAEARSFVKESDVELSVPDKWDEWNIAEREDYLEELKVVNEVEVVSEDIEIDGKKYKVWRKPDGINDIYGADSDLSAVETKKILKAFEVKTELPKEWQSLDYFYRKDWLISVGINNIGRIEEDKGVMVFSDPDNVKLTRGQIKEIFGLEAPPEWALMTGVDKSRWFIKNRILPKIAGAGAQVHEWSDVTVPNTNYTDTRPDVLGNEPYIDNPQANVRQDLETVIRRRGLLYARGLVLAAPDSDWMELEARLNALVVEIESIRDADEQRYFRVKEQFSEVSRIVKSYETNNELGQLNQIISPAFRARIASKVDALDTYYRDLYESDPRLTDEGRKVLMEKIDGLVEERFRSIESGWFTEKQAKEELIQLALENSALEPSWARGLSVWYVYEKKMPFVRVLLRETLEDVVVSDYDQFEKSIVRGIRKAESTNLSSQDMSTYFQNILHLLNKVPQESAGSLELRNALSAEIQAALFMNQLFIANEIKEGNPEHLLPILEQIKNVHADKGINTFQVYAKRYRMQYSDGSALEDDFKAPIYRDEANRIAYDFNLWSDGVNILHDQLTKEKLLLIEIRNAQRERRGVDRNVFSDYATVPDLRTPGSIQQWLEENIYMYASNQKLDRDDRNSPTYVEDWDRRIMGTMRDHLINIRGMRTEQLDRMSIILKSTMLSAFRFIQTFGWGEYDGLDLYFAEEPDENGRPIRTKKPGRAMFSSRTPFFQRIVDNPFKWLRLDARGRVLETNRIMEEQMALGYLLPTTRVLVNFADYMLRDKPRERGKHKVVNVDSINRRWNLRLGPDTSVEKAINEVTKKIRKKFGKNQANSEGLAIAELIDNGHIRFGFKPENDSEAEINKMVDWEEEVRDLNRFKFMDMFGDRNTAAKMYDRGSLQEFLRHPTLENLLKVYGENFYSGRNKRLWDNMSDALRFFHKMEQKQKKWFHERFKGSAGETLEAVEIAVRAGKLNPKDEETVLRDTLGIWVIPNLLRIPGYKPVRWTRIGADISFGFLQYNLQWTSVIADQLNGFFYFLSNAFKHMAAQVAGR